MGWSGNLDSSMVKKRQASDLEIRGSNPGPGSNFLFNI